MRTLTTLQKLSGVGTNELADQLAALQTRYAELDISEVTDGLTYAMPVMSQTKMKVNEVNAALAMLSMGGLHGEMAGVAFREAIAKLTTEDKLQPFIWKTKEGGLDLANTMQALASSLGKLSPLEQTRQLKALGFNLRDVQGIDILINRVGELKSVEADLENSRGEAAKLAAIREKSADEQWANLLQNFDLLKTSIGETLLPTVNRLIPRLADGLKSLKGWVEEHKGFVEGAMKIASWGAAILAPLGALALLGASLSFIASYAPVVFKLLISPFKLWGLAVKALTAGQWLLSAAMDANPIGLLIAGAAALAVAGYEIYEHWAAVKTFFVGLGAEFEKLGTEAFDWGVNLLKKFGEGIESMIAWPVKKVEEMAGKMARFLVGHSPIPEGPLHDLNLSRDIGRTIQPSQLAA